MVIEQEWSNLSADILSIKPGANGTPTLDLKLTNLFANNSSADGIDMSAFFADGGRYLTTEFEGLDIQSATTTDQKSNSIQCYTNLFEEDLHQNYKKGLHYHENMQDESSYGWYRRSQPPNLFIRQLMDSLMMILSSTLLLPRI